MSMNIKDIPADLWSVILSKVSPNDLNHIRMTNKEVREYINVKILPKIICRINNARVNILNDIESSMQKVTSNEELHSKMIEKDTDELRQEMKREAINKGELTLGKSKKLVVNSSGGLKACGHPVGATGVKQIVEITDQLRENAGQRQVKKAKIGLTHNIGGSGAIAVVHILRI